MKQLIYIVVSFLMSGLHFSMLNAQDVTITVNAAVGRKAVSPYLYGRNNNFATAFSGTTATSTELTLAREAGLRFARENGGNNATKYNWRLKLSSHPDWYNNVYSRDWDNMAKSIVAGIPNMQVMWAFQLIGKTASNKNNNFNDWGYNQSAWWSGCAQNLAGGGTVNTSGGSTATVNGNPALYTKDWPADSTAAILTKWFGTGGLGLNSSNFQYWNMDNEPEIWSGTHDDVMTSQLAATAFMDKYFAVAKKARALYPNIKLCGPVCANEWQWYKWGSETLYINGKYYSWMEYFLKRVADEQKATGIRLLDVVDIHWYPGETANADVVQLHRIFYDKTYVYPGANGIKSINGGWDTSQNKEYIFQRISDWLTTYFGVNHGIGLGLSESGINTTDANVNSVLYASMLGTFANNGVEYFTPWTWNTGMYETLHLFSCYAKSYSVSSTSTVENTVSAYSTVTSSADSMTVMLVNRDVSASHSVKVNLSAFSVNNGSYNALQIASLPTTETFVSHSNNALKKSTVNVSNNSFTITLPALSTTAVILKAATTDVAENTMENSFTIYPNPVSNHLNAILPGRLNGNISWKIYSTDGRLINGQQLDANAQSNLSISTSSLQNGMYLLTIQDKQTTLTKRFCVKK
ncbi:MAG: hypothetical protein RIS29_2563 [Bacteroidota bacterium]